MSSQYLKVRKMLRGRRGRSPGQNAAMLAFLFRQIQQLDRKPPFTLALMAFMYALHFQKMVSKKSYRRYSLCPDHVLWKFQLDRILTLSFLWKGYKLENEMGSVYFGFLIFFLVILSHVLVVILSWFFSIVLGSYAPLEQCAIGFSAVLFALKVVLNYNSPTYSNVYGFQVPTKYAAWLELVLIHLLVPRSSFMGHMCGILAGYLYILGSPRVSRTQWWQKLVECVQCVVRQRERHEEYRYTQASGTAGESDERIAQRLQEEEYVRFAQFQQQTHGQEPSSPNGSSLSRDELRRRRLNRMERRN